MPIFMETGDTPAKQKEKLANMVTTGEHFVFTSFVLSLSLQVCWSSGIYQVTFQEESMFSLAPKIWIFYLKKFLVLNFSRQNQTVMLVPEGMKKLYACGQKLRKRAGPEFPIPVPTADPYGYWKPFNFKRCALFRSCFEYRIVDAQYAKFYRVDLMNRLYLGSVDVTELTGRLKLANIAENTPCSSVVHPQASRLFSWSVKAEPRLSMVVNVDHILVAEARSEHCFWSSVRFASNEYATSKLPFLYSRAFCGFHSSLIFSLGVSRFQTEIKARCGIPVSFQAFYSLSDAQYLFTVFKAGENFRSEFAVIEMKRNRAAKWFRMVLEKTYFMSVVVRRSQRDVQFRFFDGPGHLSEEIKPTWRNRRFLFHTSTFQCFVLAFSETSKFGRFMHRVAPSFSFFPHKFLQVHNSTEIPNSNCKENICSLKIFGSSQFSTNLTVNILYLTGHDSFSCMTGGISIFEKHLFGMKETLLSCKSNWSATIFSSVQLFVVAYWYNNYSLVEARITFTYTLCSSVEIDPCDLSLCSLCDEILCFTHPRESIPQCSQFLENIGTNGVRFYLKKGKYFHHRKLYFQLEDTSCVVFLLRENSTRVAKRLGMNMLSFCEVELVSAKFNHGTSHLDFTIAASIEREFNEVLLVEGLFKNLETPNELKENVFVNYKITRTSAPLHLKAKNDMYEGMTRFKYLTWFGHSTSSVSITVNKFCCDDPQDLEYPFALNSMVSSRNTKSWVQLSKQDVLLFRDLHPSGVTVSFLWEEPEEDSSRQMLVWFFNRRLFENQEYEVFLQSSVVYVSGKANVSKKAFRSFPELNNAKYDNCTPLQSSSSRFSGDGHCANLYLGGKICPKKGAKRDYGNTIWCRKYSNLGNFDILIHSVNKWMSWNTTSNRCKEFGITLPIIHSLEDMTKIVSFLKVAHHVPYVLAMFINLKYTDNGQVIFLCHPMCHSSTSISPCKLSPCHCQLSF